MPIYDISAAQDEGEEAITFAGESRKTERKRCWFSMLASRMLFLLLLIGDLVWFAYSGSVILGLGALYLLSLGRSKRILNRMHQRWLAIKRSAICGICLLIAIFSPGIGIMIACTYFLMHDKKGVEEIIPSSLQEQFREFFQFNHSEVK